MGSTHSAAWASKFGCQRSYLGFIRDKMKINEYVSYMTNIIRSVVGELGRRVGQSVPFIQAVVGPRQVGKTTGVLSLEASLGHGINP